MKGTFGSAAPAILLCTAALLPFHDKAFTVDDTLFLRQAAQLLEHPLHPTAFEMVWSEAPFPLRVSRIMPSGTLMAYLLVPVVLLGGAEWLAHLLQLAALAATVLATVSLGLRLGLGSGGAATAGLLLAATPAVLAMASTGMPDVPAMALGAVAIERLHAWRLERRGHQAVIGALALGLAPLARPHLWLLLAVAALVVTDPLRDRARFRVPWSRLAPVAAAPLLTLALALLTRDPLAGAGSQLGAVRTYSAIDHFAPNLLAFAAHWVLALPLAVPWVLLRYRALAARPTSYAATALAALAVMGLPGERTGLWLAPIAGLGGAVLWDVLADGWRRRDATRLLLATWLFVPLVVTPYLHLPSKYLLVSAPAVALLVAGELSNRPRLGARCIAGVTLAGGLALGVLVIRADAAFAGLGRRAAAELIAPHVAAGRQVWFDGHWGFQWYAEQAGARCLTATPPHPARGDLAVSSLRSMGGVIAGFPRRRLLASLSDDAPGGRLMSREDGAGFFSNDWGYLPWAWGTGELDRFDLWTFE